MSNNTKIAGPIIRYLKYLSDDSDNLANKIELIWIYKPLLEGDRTQQFPSSTDVNLDKNPV